MDEGEPVTGETAEHAVAVTSAKKSAKKIARLRERRARLRAKLAKVERKLAEADGAAAKAGAAFRPSPGPFPTSLKSGARGSPPPKPGFAIRAGRT